MVVLLVFQPNYLYVQMYVMNIIIYPFLFVDRLYSFIRLNLCMALDIR